MLNVENVLIDVAQLMGNNRSVNISGMAQFNDYSTKNSFWSRCELWEWQKKEILSL